MRVPCACKIYLIDPEHSSFVRDGIPLCGAATCEKVREHQHMRREANNADRVPNEVYAKRYPDI
jgi:hypothetical protein